MGIEELIIEHLKQEFVKECIQKGEDIGIRKGEKIGIRKGIKISIENMLSKGFEPAFIAEALSADMALILEIEKALKKERRSPKPKK